jgi:glycosyltransferase involved in cell wall biosynthesis
MMPIDAGIATLIINRHNLVIGKKSKSEVRCKQVSPISAYHCAQGNYDMRNTDLPPTQILNKKHPTYHLWVNGRFLGRKITGVERVAHEILAALAEKYLDAHGIHRGPKHNVQLHWAVPADFNGKLPPYGAEWDLEVVGQHKGHAWEQWSLARHRPNDWTLSLCNTAPLFRQNQAVFFHDAQVFALPDNFNWRFRLWYKCLLRIAGRRAKILLTNSSFSMQELAKFTGIASERFKVIHLGVDHMLRLKPELPEKVRQIKSEKPWVLAVSSASPNKNFAGALQAAKSANVHLVIAGQTNSKIFAQVAIDKSQVTELGYVSDEELIALYQKASCLLYPSFYEGFGLPPLEAMMVGCPVVVSETSSMSEVCGLAAKYCQPSDAVSIQQALEHILSLPGNVKAALSEQGKEHASHFTWARSAQTLWDHFIDSIEQRK